MTRAAIFVGACLAAFAPAVAGAAPAVARAAAQVSVVSPARVQLNWTMAMPSVRGTRSGAVFAGNAPTMSMATGMMVRNDSLTIRREEESAAVPTAPGSFMVRRLDDTDAMLVRTSAGGGLAAMASGVILGGRLVGGSAASIDVGARTWLASAPASPEGSAGQMLVVVVQYN
jgi:hypothetical protein